MSMTESERRAVNEQLRHRGPASHDAWRVIESGYQSTPCWCAGRSWHRVGNETPEPAECYFTADSTYGERFCHTHGEEHTADVEIRTGSPSGGPEPLEGT